MKANLLGIAFAMILLLALGWCSVRESNECHARGGIYLPREHICLRGELAAPIQ